MRYLFTLIIAVSLLASCKKDTEGPTRLTIRTAKQKSNDSGTYTTWIGGTIKVWKADGRDLEIRSAQDAVNGLAFDKRTNANVQAEYSGVNGILVEHVTNGKYLVFVIDTDTKGEGENAYSHLFFNVKYQDEFAKDKVFSLNSKTGSFEAWGK